MWLINRVALVTGASRGLGFAIAKELQGRGFDLFLTASGRDGLEEVRQKLNQTTRVEYLDGDISRSDTALRLSQACHELYGLLDLLVSNAGVFAGGSLSEFDEASWDRIIAINLKAGFLVTKAMLPLLKESKGQIIFINSVGGKIGLKNLSAYSASKFGLRGLADSLRLELKSHGIRVTSVFPHGMNSAGKLIPDDDPLRWTQIETADVAHVIGEVADSPVHVQIPEIVIYPRSTEISKQDKPL